MTRFTTLIRESTTSTPLEDYEYYQDHLRETLDQLLSLDNDMQDLLDDSKYTTDVEVCEEYIDSTKQALLKAKREIKNRPVSTGEGPNFAEEPSASRTLRPPLVHSVLLTDLKKRVEKLKAKGEMLAKFDADRKARREKMDASHKEMEACPEEKKPTSVDRKPKAAQQEEVPIEDATVLLVRGPKKKQRRDRNLAT
jgi:hypothetical protein